MVRSWLLEASDDLAAARVLATAGPMLADPATLHCYEAAEKALKGFLAFWGHSPGGSHEVGQLIERAAEIEPVFVTWTDAADRLSTLAALLRDPRDSGAPGPEDLAEAIDDAETVVRQVIAFLPPEVHPEPDFCGRYFQA